MKVEQKSWFPQQGWVNGVCAGGLADSAQLVFLFGSPGAVQESGALDLARKLYPRAEQVGCSTAGEIQGALVSYDSVAMTAIAFEGTTVKTSCCSIESPEQSRAAGERVAGELPLPGLRHVFVLSEGLRVNPSELVRGVTSVLSPAVRVSGGFAGDGDRLAQTHVWCNAEPLEASVVAVGFYGDRLRVGCSATGAWGPFGPDRLVTRSKGNTLFELDGRPVLALYKKYLGELAEGLPATGLQFPLLIHSPDSEHFVLRAMLAVDEQQQSITFAGDIPEGWFARMMHGTIEGLLEGTFEAAQACRSTIDASAEFSILVSCNGRRHVLKQRVDEEIEAVQEVFGPQTALTGFYSYGEIAPVAVGEVAELHNETMTITCFSEV
jgi:hypothetical protein